MTDAGATVLMWWGGTALFILLASIVIGIWAGHSSHEKRFYAVLLDSRGRFSLTHLQIYLWSVIVISMIAGVVMARAFWSDADPFAFSIPDELLIVMGISVGSAVTAEAAKAARNASNPDGISASSGAASADADRPHFVQVFLREEGDLANETVDIAKFQNFWITLILVVGYIVTAIDAFRVIPDVTAISTLPIFSATFVTLLGISHAAYVADKLPPRPGNPKTLTLTEKRTADFWKKDEVRLEEHEAAQRELAALAEEAERQEARATAQQVLAERLADAAVMQQRAADAQMEAQRLQRQAERDLATALALRRASDSVTRVEEEPRTTEGGEGEGE